MVICIGFTTGNWNTVPTRMVCLGTRCTVALQIPAQTLSSFERPRGKYWVATLLKVGWPMASKCFFSFFSFSFFCNPSNDLTLLRVFFLFYPRYVGTGECVVFQIKPGPFRMYNWTGKNSYFMLGNAPLFAFVLLHTHS